MRKGRKEKFKNQVRGAVGRTAAAFAILLGVQFITAFSSYADSAQLGTPSFDGTGCKPNTASAVLSPDGLSLSLIFDDYLVRAGSGVRGDRKYCNIILPFALPAGKSLSILQADYRGFHSLPNRAVTEFKTSYQFDGNHPHPGRKQKYRGALNGEFIDTDFERLASKCGGSAQLSVRTELILSTNDHGDDAFSQIDSADYSTPTAAVPVLPLDRYRNRDRLLEGERERDGERRRKKDRGVRFLFRIKPCNSRADTDSAFEWN
jgi:hypothetical protein